MGYHVYLGHGTSVYWHIKSRLESAPVQEILHPLLYIAIIHWETTWIWLGTLCRIEKIKNIL